MQAWCDFWPSFLDRERLNSVVDELNELDKDENREQTIEDICKGVYLKYDQQDEVRLKNVRIEFQKRIDDIAHVHLSTSRVKTINSILRKIITKRHGNYFSKTSPYATLTEENYQDALTDLVGVRVILSYRGDWKEVHSELLGLFPLKEKSVYKGCLLPHEDGKTFMAEWPKAYYAEGDDTLAYLQEDVEPNLHKKGYRSVHYTISFMGTYIELQVRTIYDEAWSDVDHRYVYKQEANPSNDALMELSGLLCQLTNLSNDIGEQMRAIFDGQKMSKVAEDSSWLVTGNSKEFFLDVTAKLDDCKRKFEDMCSRMVVEDTTEE